MDYFYLFVECAHFWLAPLLDGFEMLHKAMCFISTHYQLYWLCAQYHGRLNLFGSEFVRRESKKIHSLAIHIFLR